MLGKALCALAFSSLAHSQTPAFELPGGQTWLDNTLRLVARPAFGSFEAGSRSGSNSGSATPSAGYSLSAQETSDAAYLITTVVGTVLPATAIPGTAVSSIFMDGVAADSQGNTYFAAASRNAVFKLNADGVLTRVAGNGTPGFSGDGGAATTAQLRDPQGVAVDGSGNLYIADNSNARIRKVALSNGLITTVAGSTSGFSGDGGAAISAKLNRPEGVAVDAAGNLYIADSYNYRIRKVTVATGRITTVAGNGTPGYFGDGGIATEANMSTPSGIAVDTAGNIYFADVSNNRIRKITGSNGIITTVAGDGLVGFSGDGGPASSAKLSFPTSVAVDTLGNVYIADRYNCRIRKVIAETGVISTVAGAGDFGYSGDGGPATKALLTNPHAVAIDRMGSLYITDRNTGRDITDREGSRVRKVFPDGTITTVVGGGDRGQGLAVFAHIAQLGGVARDGEGNIYVSIPALNRVKKIASNGLISTVAGNGADGFSGDGGPAIGASLSVPAGVAVDAAGNLYFADSNNHRIRKVTASTGTITTVAGNGVANSSGDGGPAVKAGLYRPMAVAVDASGNLYITDFTLGLIRKVNASTGVITTVAGNGLFGSAGDGGPATSASLSGPSSVALDAAGNIYIAEYGGNRVRKITASTGIITTVAGNGIVVDTGDGGAATSAGVPQPTSVLVNPAGDVFVSVPYHIRKVAAASGVITTVAGNGTPTWSGDGGPATSSGLGYFSLSLAAGSNGEIYIADWYNGVVRLLTPVNTSAVLTVRSTHSGILLPTDSGSYTLTVTNAASAGPTSGPVTVTEALPAALTLVSMFGPGWDCGASSCTRSDVLSGGASYPPITVVVNAGSTMPEQVTNQAIVAGGGAATTATQDLTQVSPSLCSYVLAAGTPGGASFNNAGGIGTATVSTRIGCSWNASSSDPSWLATASTGDGSGTISYTVAPNAGTNLRTGTITAGGQALTVSQAAGPAGLTPTISAGGVVNTASYAPGGPPSGSLGRGSLFTIYGSGLGPDVPATAAGYPLPATLGGASVQVVHESDNYDAPLVFVSKGQINAILPSNTPLGKAKVVVNRNGATSQPADITVANTTLGVFLRRVNGTDLAMAQNQDYRLNSPDTPAKPGEIVIFWATGLGPVNGPDNIPGSSGDMTDVPITITVGGIAAERIYAGRQSETPAVDNVYFKVPADAPYSCQIPVSITAGGIVANTTNIAITAGGSPCVPPPAQTCVNIAGQWLATESGTLTCTLTIAGESDTETDPISGGDIVTVSQQGCRVSYTSPSMLASFGSGKAVRTGQLDGANVKFTGIMGELAPGFSYDANLLDASGTVENNVIHLSSSGTLIGSGTWQGMSANFSCTAKTTGTLQKWPQ